MAYVGEIMNEMRDQIADLKAENARLTDALRGTIQQVEDEREKKEAAVKENARLKERVQELEARFVAPVVCMCGSTRFKQTWISENARLTGEGNIVLAVGLWGHHERVFPNERTKKQLDELHKRKIDLCDWVWVLDVGGYIGESTTGEIGYAARKGKPVRYLSQEFPGYTEPIDPIQSRLAQAEGLLKELEWIENICLDYGEEHCPECHEPRSKGHNSNCFIAAFLHPEQAGDKKT